MTLEPIRQAPDDLMQVPIRALLAKAARRVQRMHRLAEMVAVETSRAFGRPTDGSAGKRHDIIEAVAQRERTLCQVAAVALRARAPEVCRFCDSIGLMNCTPALVRDKPLEVALATQLVQCRARESHEH